MKVTTQSGTVYYFHNRMVRRVQGENAQALRRGAVWLRMEREPVIEVGSSMILTLEPLGDNCTATIRMSTPVVLIEGLDNVV